MRTFSQKLKGLFERGFILPMTLLVCAIVLAVTTGISMLLTKELYFSRISRESQLAYYAADIAMMCAIMVDEKYIDPSTGLGIFPHNGLSTDTNIDIQNVLDEVNLERQYRNLSSLSINDIKCATVPIFDSSTSLFSTVPFQRLDSNNNVELGQTSIFVMHMDLGDGTLRCATVSVSKTDRYRQIIARGFTSCGNGSSKVIERAIISTTEAN